MNGVDDCELLPPNVNSDVVVEDAGFAEAPKTGVLLWERVPPNAGACPALP